MVQRKETPVFTSKDVDTPKKEARHRCIMKADDIVTECLEGIIYSVFKLAQHDLKVAIKKLQALDMTEVRNVYGKKHVGQKLTKSENGINMRYAAHYRQIRELERFFTSEWAVALGIRNGNAIIRNVDQACGYKTSEERRRLLYVPNLLIENEFGDRTPLFSEDDLYDPAPDLKNNGQELGIKIPSL